jgi:hypothetical protein
MPPDAVALARRLAVLARQAESLAEDAEQDGPFKDGMGAEHFKAQAASLRRQHIIITARPNIERLRNMRLSQRSPRPRRRRVTSGPRKARAPDEGDPSGDGGEPEESSGCSTSPSQPDFLDAVALSLGWERAA